MAKSFRIPFTDSEAAELLAYKPLAHWQELGRAIKADALRTARLAKYEADVAAAVAPPVMPDTSQDSVTIV